MAMAFATGFRRTWGAAAPPTSPFVAGRLAVFVDGCFWHGCPEHGRTDFAGPNADLWQQKMRRNRERDQRANALAHAHGFRVLRLWECQVRGDPQRSASLVRAMLENPASDAERDDRT